MRSVDKRVSTNIPNIFWKTKFKKINQIHQQVSFALCRTQTKGKKITAQTLLDKQQRQNIINYDDGYWIFKNIRSSPPYFEHKKKELMAMIQQLGIPTLFISLSAADTKWVELLRSIYRGMWGGAVRWVQLRHKVNQPVLDSRRRHRPDVDNTGAILMDLFAIY